MKLRTQYLEKMPDYKIFNLPDGTQDLIVFSFQDEDKDEDGNVVYIYETNQMHGTFDEDHVAANVEYYLNYEAENPKSQIERIKQLEEISTEQDLALAEVMEISLANSEALAESIEALMSAMEV
jgi:hypothetical protein